MQITVPLPKKGHLKQLILHDVPGDAILRIFGMEIPLLPGIQVVDFAKMLNVLKQRIQGGFDYPFRLENGFGEYHSLMLYHIAAIQNTNVNSAYDYESDNFRGLNLESRTICSIRTVGPEYNYKMFWKGKEVHSGRETVIQFPECYIDRVEIENVPIRAKLIFVDAEFIDLSPGKAVIDFRDMLQDLKCKKQWSHANRDVIDVPSQYAITRNEWILSIMIGFVENNLIDWKSPQWEGISGEIASRHFANDKTMKIRTYPNTVAKCEYRML